MEAAGTVYFHSGCFDGVVSSIIAADFLEELAGWSSSEFRPVDYTLGKRWAGEPLPVRSAVVDFLFHPGAQFWADHHPTTFVHSGPPGPERNGTWRLYDKVAPSCARLLLNRLPAAFRRTSKHDELARWADKTDTAQYASVEEALFSAEPAMQIHAALGTRMGHEMAPYLIRALREESLDQVAGRPQVLSLARAARASLEDALAQVRSALRRLPGEVAYFDVSDLPDAPGARYAPYSIWPAARYSVAVVRSQRGVKITAMRNPWQDFKGVHLGELMARLGGGGHERVAALELPPEQAGRAEAVVQAIAAELDRPGSGRGTAAPPAA